MLKRIVPWALTIVSMGMVAPAISEAGIRPDQVAAAPVDTVRLRVVRFDDGPDTLLVSNGIPLPPGALRPTDTRRIRLLVEGEEQRLHVEPLAGRHPDGSLRSILVQFRYPVPRRGTAYGQLIIGQARETADIPKPDNDRSVLSAAALPRDANYLVSTDLNGPTITSYAARSMGGTWARYEGDFVRMADAHWQKEGPAWNQSNYYDRALIYAAWWVRTANPEYFRRAALIAVDYRTKYLEANNYGTSPHWSQLEGLEQHYLMTGDEKSRYAIARVAEIMHRNYDPKITDTSRRGWIENRIQARILQSYFLAWRLNAVGTKPTNWAKLMDDALTRILSTQREDGSYGFQSTCLKSLNYMTGLLNDVFIKLYSYYKADPRIRSAVERSATFLWDTQWLPQAHSFKYVSGGCINPSGMQVGGPSPAPDLNGLFVTTFGWLYQQTGNTTYRARGDAIFAGGVQKAYLTGTKQFNESYSASYRYLRYRRGR